MLTLRGVVHVKDSLDALYDALGQLTLSQALNAVEQRGVFHLALSGGSTPERFYMHLASDPRFRGIPWPQTHLWVVDERRVPEDDNRNNFRMIRESLADHVPMRKRFIHPMPVMEDDPAGAYEASIREAFDLPADADPATVVPAMDLVLLGMGGDCHTASLFPHSPAQAIDNRWIVVNAGETVTPPDRLTMTYPLINAARHIAVLVTGEGKRDALQQVDAAIQSGGDIADVPIAGIEPTTGVMSWHLDRAAAG